MSNNVTDITVRTYDEYLVKKIENAIITDVDGKPLIPVIYSPFDLAFEYAMKRQKTENKNQIKFPLIICHKSAGFSISDMTHRVLNTKIPVYYVDYTYDGTPAPTPEVPTPEPVTVRVSRYVQIINVDIPYNIEILTKDENQAFELAQEIIFLLIRDPFIEVPKFRDLATIPEVEKTNFIFSLMMDNEVADNTALETESEVGKLYRVTISVTVNDAALSRDVNARIADTIQINIEGKSPDLESETIFSETIDIQ